MTRSHFHSWCSRHLSRGIVFLIGLFLFSSSPLSAQMHPAFSASFGNNGVMYYPTFGLPTIEDMFADDSARVYALISLLDDSNSTESAAGEVIRFHSDGALDQDYGTGGSAAISFPGFFHSQPTRMIQDHQDKLYVLGLGIDTSDAQFMCVTRLLSNGETDTSFAQSGLLQTRFMEEAERPVVITLDNQDRLLIGGGTRDTADDMADSDAMVIARYTTAGLIDTSFGGTGKINVDLLNGLSPLSRHASGGFATNIFVDSEGRIILSGAYSNTSYYDGVIVRLTESGKLDKNFNQTGFMAVDPGVGYNSFINHMVQVSDDEYAFSMTTIDPYYFRNFTYGRARLSSASYETAEADFFGNSDECTGFVLSGDLTIMSGYSTRQSKASSDAKPDYAAIAQVNTSDTSAADLTTITLDSSLQFGADAIVETSDGKLIAGGFQSGPIPIIVDLMFFELDRNALNVPKLPIESREWSIYPNPASERVAVTGVPSGASYVIFSALGERVAHGSLDGTSLDVSHLQKGTFWISLDYSGRQEFVQFIKN